MDLEELINIDAEESLIASVLVNPLCYEDIKTRLNPNDFAIGNNGNAWIAFENLFKRKLPIDLITVSEELSRINHLDFKSAQDYLLRIMSKTPSSMNIKGYVDIVIDYSNRRNFLEALQEIVQVLINKNQSIEQALEIYLSHLRYLREKINSDEEKIKILDSSDALKKRDPINWIVDQIIAPQTINILVGDGGSKKTYIGLWLSVRISNGLDFLGYPTSKQKVLYIDEEMGESFLLDRIAEVERGSLTNGENKLLAISCANFNLTKNNDLQELEDLIIENEIGVIILDSFSSLLGSLDENQSKDTSPFFINLRQIIKRTGCTFIIIHHTNKSNNYRGSTDIKNKVDLMLQIDSRSSNNLVKFKSEKVRHGRPLAFTGLCHWEDDQFWMSRGEETNREILNQEEEYILKYLNKKGAMKRENIISSTSVFSESSLSNAIYSLVDKEKIYRTNPEQRGRGSKAIYTIKN